MTPTMEEVAGWLREEGRRIFSYWLEAAGDEFATKKSTLWFERAAQVEAMGWLPIEAAPKDGTHIDLWNSSANKRLTDCRWDGNNRWVRWDENAFGVMAWCVVKGKISHFMHRPQPPVKK